MSSREPGRHALAFILVTVLLDTMGIGIIIPVLPELIMELTGQGLSRAAIYGGWLSFVYALMQFVCAPILGNLSDRFGRRPVILYSVASMGVDYTIMGIAPGIGWLFLGRTLSGIAGASFTPAYAYVADITSRDKRAQSFGMIGAAFGAGFVFGPALGGLLGQFGTRAPFFVAAGLSGLNFLYGVLVLPESLATPIRRPFSLRRANPVGTLLQVRRYPTVLGLLGALFLWQVAHQVMPSTWAFYTMFKFDWSEAMVGLSLAVVGVVLVFGQGTLPRVVVPRIGERRAALLGLGVGAVGFAGFAFATRGWMLFAILVTWGMAALATPSIRALASHQVPNDAQGELQGAVASLQSLAAIVSPPVMTQLFRRFTAAAALVRFPGAPFLFAGVLGAGAFLLMRAGRRDPDESEAPRAEAA